MFEKTSSLTPEDIIRFGPSVLAERAKKQFSKDLEVYNKKLESIFKNCSTTSCGTYSSYYDLKDHSGAKERFTYLAFKLGLQDGFCDREAGNGDNLKYMRTEDFVRDYNAEMYRDSYKFGYNVSQDLFYVCKSVPRSPIGDRYDYHSPVDSQFNQQHLKNITDVRKGRISDKSLVDEIQVLIQRESSLQMEELKVPTASIQNGLSLEQISWLASGIPEFAIWLDGDFHLLNGKATRWASYYEVCNHGICLELHDSGYAKVSDCKSRKSKDLLGISLVYSSVFDYSDDNGADIRTIVLSYEATPADPTVIRFGEGGWTETPR